MKHLTTLMLALTCACAHTTDRIAVFSHEAVDVADQTWDAYVDTRLVVCKDAVDPAECIEPIAQADDAIADAITTYVIALRAYWFARASDDKVGAIKALRAMASAIQSLPTERFGAAQRLLRIK